MSDGGRGFGRAVVIVSGTAVSHDGKRMARREPYNPGQWQVERERSQIQNRRPNPTTDRTVPVASVIPGIMKTLGLESQLWLDRLAEEWPELAGKAVAMHTRPGRVQKGNLVVFVDSSVWLNELSRYGKGPMLAGVQKRFGADKIKSVSFLLDPEGGRSQRSSAFASSPSLGATADKAVRGQGAEDKDPGSRSGSGR